MLLRLSLVLALILGAIGLGTLGLQLLAPAPLPAAPQAAAPPPPPPPARRRVLAAARALPLGTLLKDEDLAVRNVAPEAATAALQDTPETRAELRGALVRRWLEPGTLLGREDMLRPRDRGFLAAVLRPGHRAVSVGVDVVTGTAGLIWPGDQVDLILTQELAAADAPLGRRVVGETILSDIRVIAVDQHFTQGAAAGDATATRIARTVTLEVIGEQAERIAVGSRLGRIALAVRAMEPAGGATPAASSPTPVFGADVSPTLGHSDLSQGMRMRVIQGDEAQDVTFR